MGQGLVGFCQGLCCGWVKGVAVVAPLCLVSVMSLAWARIGLLGGRVLQDSGIVPGVAAALL